MWQWFRFLVSNVPEGKKMILLNLDETSIKFWYQPREGLQVRAKRKSSGSLGPAGQASRGQLRKAITHVAVICDNPAFATSAPTDHARERANYVGARPGDVESNSRLQG